MQEISGRTLMEWGLKPGRAFPAALAAVRAAAEAGGDAAAQKRAAAAAMPVAPPVLPLRTPGALAATLNILPDGPEEVANVTAVASHMAELLRVPTIVAGAVMPDACPSGPVPGTIPVGGVAAAREAIHPGMHSADICCSMAVSIFRPADMTAVLDAGMALSHFGGGGRPPGRQIQPP